MFLLIRDLCNKNSGVLLSSEESDQVSVTKPGVADREATIEGQENARTVGSTGLGPNEETPGHPLAEDIHKENGHREPVVPEMLQTEGEGGLKGDSVMVTPIEGNTLEAVIPNNYTPLGSWVSTRILGRNKLIKNMRKNNYDLLLNDAGNRETSLNDPMYHIRYNSSTNNEFILD
ncbi:hypothetical protein PVBG_06165 [Plasmodium vivax Brazil I]|uniref:VIR protein n=1 Tax=Plasmodium vivax (strain Brazil I) TaxID=1033975 RepID=A0A0J9VCP6_PLAV1|nr:hypothetical protein PVBG_06165 [Plasmodium vivax Brazil I]